LIKLFPTAPDAASAEFFTAESYYQLKKYREAIPEYQKLIETYKSSEWLPDAYFMQGDCHQLLKQTTQARTMFERVRSLFPNSPQAINAAQRLKNMGFLK
jgi:TolA-binding protein